MQHDQKQLHEIAQNYPCYMFTVEENALLCNVARDVISKVRGAADSPFFMNKCRPEWVLEWMRTHPGFQLTKESPLLLKTGATVPTNTPSKQKLKKKKLILKALGVQKQ